MKEEQHTAEQELGTGLKGTEAVVCLRVEIVGQWCGQPVPPPPASRVGPGLLDSQQAFEGLGEWDGRWEA